MTSDFGNVSSVILRCTTIIKHEGKMVRVRIELFNACGFCNEHVSPRAEIWKSVLNLETLVT